jgi:hypothetical protein
LDYVKAYRLYARSAAGGNNNGTKRLQSLRQIMTPRQINEAMSAPAADPASE